MILIDFGIICIGQEKRRFPKGLKSVRFESHKRTEKSEEMYDDWYNFKTADRLTGMWYFVWLTDDIFLEQSFFDIAPKGSPWVIAQPEWKDTVERILRFYIERSPQKKIAVLLRIQDRSEDVSHKQCTLCEFMDLLTQGSIRWNELYFIGDNTAKE